MVYISNLWKQYTELLAKSLLALLVLFSLQAPAANYYWVGGSGSWSGLSNWASSPGGAGGAYSKVPTTTDNVYFTTQSFTAAAQVVTVSSSASCASLDFTGSTNIYNTPATAPTFKLGNSITVTGNITLAANLIFRMDASGSIIAMGTGTKTIDGKNVPLRNGRLTINDAGVWNLASNLNLDSSILFVNKGTLNTAGYTIDLKQFISSTSNARSINLGSSKINFNMIPGTSNVSGSFALDFTNANLQFSAGTSVLNFVTLVQNATATFNSGGRIFNGVEINMPGPSATFTINNDNTFAFLRSVAGGFNVIGNNTINDSLILAKGTTNTFTYNKTTTFGLNTYIKLIGTQANVIYLKSSSTSNTFVWTKPGGVVCADQCYIKFSKAQGGASWTDANTNFNQGNNYGWTFGSSTPNYSAIIEGGTKCKNDNYNLKFTFSGVTYPLNFVLRNLQNNTTQTITGVTTSPYYLPVSPAVTTIYRIEQISTNACFNSAANVNSADTVIIPDYSGPCKWTGLVSNNWLDCRNWSNFRVPTDSTDVVIQKQMLSPFITWGRALAKKLHISHDADLNLVGASTVLSVFGNFTNNGVLNAGDSKVEFIGEDVTEVAAATYTDLTINNTTVGGLSLTGDIVVEGSLNLANGIINTNGHKIIINNAASNALLGFSDHNYIKGTLVRAVRDTGTYAFPVGDDVVMTLTEVRPNKLLGVDTIEASFIPKPGEDIGLNCVENGVRYSSIHSSGVVLLRPNKQPIGGNYDLLIDVRNMPGLTDNNFVILCRNDTSTNAADWNTGGGTLPAPNTRGRTVAGGVAIRKGLSHFSQWGIGMNDGEALPVKLTSFEAKPLESAINLKWTTHTEINNSGFMVERSTNARQYSILSFMPGAGNTTEVKNYEYTDKTVKPKMQYYYRLKQVDYDGKYEYSSVEAAMIGGGGKYEMTEFIPNPSRDFTNINITATEEEIITIEFKNVLGAIVKSEEVMVVQGANTCRFNTANLLPGNYLVSIRSKGQYDTKRLVIRN
jgi:hypothetical protein